MAKRKPAKDRKQDDVLPTSLSVIDYDAGDFHEFTTKSADECISYMEKRKTVTWINVSGLKDKTVLEKLCHHFGLHPLVIEDILHTSQRPKVEDYEEYLFMVARMLHMDGNGRGMHSEQVSLVLGKSFVISFQEEEGDIFNPVRDRIRNNKGRIRRSGPDFLAYSLLDMIVDNYFLILEEFGEQIEHLEDELVRSASTRTLQRLQKLKHDMVILRKSVWPLREVVNSLEREVRSKTPLIGKSTALYLRDLYDHTIQVIDTVETYRDMTSGMLDIYLSSVSNKLNEVMKVLTIIGTIFIPLTFVTGLYGMNFKFMPELSHPAGYPAVLVIMLLMIIGMLFYFRRKKWI